MRQKFLAHSNTGIRNLEFKSRLSVVFRLLLDFERHLSAFRGELHRVAQNVDEHLPELHVVAYVVVIDRPVYMALVFQALIGALAAEHDVDGLKQLLERELLVLQRELARLYA